jgi:hypothetical protein
MSATIIAAIITGGLGFIGGCLIVYFRVQANKGFMGLIAKKIDQDKDSKIADLKLEIEKLKNERKRTKTDSDRLTNEQLEVLFKTVDESVSAKESVIALRKFGEFITYLHDSVAPRNFYEDYDHYQNDTVFIMDSKLPAAIKFIEGFLKVRRHLYDSKGIPSDLEELREKCRNIQHDQDDNKNNGGTWEMGVEITGKALGEVWDEFHRIYQTIVDDNDELIRLKKKYINSLKKN